MILYHVGFVEIPEPDVHFGRKNADFGQGFYMSDNYEFSCRWSKERKGSDTILNTYAFDPEGLQILRMERDEEWLAYVYDNRGWKPDRFPQADVVIGPIANDTIYNTLGIITSGLLTREQAMKLLLIGPVYRQIVLKTERAAARLRWLSARCLETEEIRRYRAAVAEEEAEYQRMVAEAME